MNFDCEKNYIKQYAASVAAAMNAPQRLPREPVAVSLAYAGSLAANAATFLFPPGTSGEFTRQAAVPGVTAPNYIMIGALALEIKPAVTAAVGLCELVILSLQGTAYPSVGLAMNFAKSAAPIVWDKQFCAFSGLSVSNDATSDSAIVFAAKFDGWLVSMS